MKTRPFIFLSPEITRANAFAMMDWLKDEQVTRYLSDSRHVSRAIEQVVNRVNLPTLTHLFSQGGRFFMACDRQGVPVGFVRLVKTGADYEMVMVIGDRDNWGKRLGTSTLQESLKTAFLDLRAGKLIARIQPQNLWSIRAFRNCGFTQESSTATLMTFSMTLERYLALSRDTATSSDICITAVDKERLQLLIASERNRQHMHERTLHDLAFEVGRAIVVAPRQVSRDVVTMNSRARLRMNNSSREISLVYPRDASGDSRNVSVFSPVGTAILGFRQGDQIDWHDQEGNLQIHIEEVLYQPEAAGDFHL